METEQLVTIFVQLPGRASSCSLGAVLSETVFDITQRLLNEGVVSSTVLAGSSLQLDGEDLSEHMTLAACGVRDEAILVLVPVPMAGKKPRWMVTMVVMLSCLMMLGSFFCLENPAALMKQLESEMRISNLHFNAWYTATYAAVLLSSVTVSARLCRRCGLGFACCLFSLLVVCGQALFAFGCALEGAKSEDGSLSIDASATVSPLPQAEGYWLSVLGRFVFGFGYESLITANQGLLADWFGDSDNDQYFFSLGMAYCIARLVAVLNYNITPYIVELYGSVPHGLCAFKGLPLAIFKLPHVRCSPREPPATLPVPSLLLCHSLQCDISSQPGLEIARCTASISKRLTCWRLAALDAGAGAVVCAGSFGAALLLALLTAVSPPQSKQAALRKRRMSVEQAAAEQEEGETIRFAHAKHFNASFWLICTTKCRFLRTACQLLLQ